MGGNGPSIGRWISILYWCRQNYFGKRLEPYNIGSGQQIFLMVLSKKDGISQEELSDFLKIDKATTAKAIKKLEAAGYVSRDVDTMDRRAYRVCLTDKALAIVPVIEAVVKEWEQLITAGISESESEMIEDLLDKMAHNACQTKSIGQEA